MATTSTATQGTTAGADPRRPADVVETAPARGHIGRIVAGSLIGGLVAAVFLVAVPFAGGDRSRHHRFGAPHVRRRLVRAGDAVATLDGPAPALGLRARGLHGDRGCRGAGGRTDRQRARMDLAAGRVRARRVDDRARPTRSPQPHARLDPVPRVRGAVAVVPRRRVRDLPRIDRPLPDGRPADRRRRPQAAHRLHRHRQSRRSCSNPAWASRPPRWHGSPPPSPRPPGSASTTAPVAAGANPPARPQDGVEVATDLHTLLAASRRTRAVRAGRSLRRRHLRPQLRAPLPRAGRGSRPARLDASGAVHEDRFVARVLRDVPSGLGGAPVAVPLRCRACHVRVRVQRPARSGS